MRWQAGWLGALSVTPTLSATTVNVTTLNVSGVGSFANGANNAPSITFTSDPDLGLYRVAANLLAIQAEIGIELWRNGSRTLSLTTTENTNDTNTNMNLQGYWTSGSNGYAWGGLNQNRAALKHATELVTIAAAADTTTSNLIPANALVLGVTVRVTTVIPTAATFDIGVSGATTRYGTGLSTAANTTNASTGALVFYTAATPLVITPNLTPANNTGRVRVTVHYMLLTPATS